MTGKIIIALLLAWVSVPGIAADRTLTLAAWNIEHLAAADDQGCRPREASEYEAIRRYLQRAQADVIAFQEVETCTRPGGCSRLRTTTCIFRQGRPGNFPNVTTSPGTG